MINLNFRGKNITSFVVMFIVGLLLVVIPSDTLLGMLFTFLGLGIILLNIIPCIVSITMAMQDKKNIPFAIYQSLVVFVGVLIIVCWDNIIMAIILGVFLILIPIIRIIENRHEWSKTLMKQAPYLLFGILLFFIPLPAVLGIILRVFGSIIMIYSLVIIIIYYSNKNKDDDNHNDFNEPDNKGPKNDKDRIIIDAEVEEIN